MECVRSLFAAYDSVLHPPLVLFLCIAGSVGHMVTIATLITIRNPINVFLISMSCSQLMLCVNFLYSTFFKWASDELCSPFFFSFYLVKTMHLSVTLSVLVHMAGVFHVVALSLIRYFSLARISSENSNIQWFCYKKCRWSIIGIYVSVTIIGIPLYFTSEVVEVPQNDGCASRFPYLRNASAYQLQFSTLPYLSQFNFWLFNLCSKIIPSIILSVMTFMIVDILSEIRVLSARFGNVKRDKQHQRTTKMILIIMFMFIIIEFPQGILAVLATVTDFDLIYDMGDFYEMVTMLNSCIIFALLCSMNGRIRTAFSNSPSFQLIQKYTSSTWYKRFSSSKSTESKQTATLLKSSSTDKTQSYSVL